MEYTAYIRQRSRRVELRKSMSLIYCNTRREKGREGERERESRYPRETEDCVHRSTPPTLLSSFGRLASTDCDDTLLSKRCSYKTGQGPLILACALCRIRRDIIAVRFAKGLVVPRTWSYNFSAILRLSRVTKITSLSREQEGFFPRAFHCSRFFLSGLAALDS